MPSEGAKSPDEEGRRAPAFEESRMTKPRLPVRNGVWYRDAMMKKENWIEFMDEPTEQFEAFVYKHFPFYSDPCPVCDAGGKSSLLNGIRVHLLSQKHWTSLWKKFHRKIPSANDAVDWDRPWVQKLEVPGGTYLYNHVTGEQGMEEDVRSVKHQKLDVFKEDPAILLTVRQIRDDRRRPYEGSNTTWPPACRHGRQVPIAARILHTYVTHYRKSLFADYMFLLTVIAF